MFSTLLILLLYTPLALAEKSFTIVVDTTESMQEELDILKANIGSVANHVARNADITNYILVVFNDPEVGPPLIHNSPQGLVDSLSRLSARGGRDCPENSLAGIEKALEVSMAESNVYVFTDAYAKDYSKLESIAQLCKNKRSQVNILLSGSCPPLVSTQENINVYYDVTKACSGSLFQFDSVHLRQAFKYIKEVTKVDWTDIITHDVFTNYKKITYSMDSFTKDFAIAISGEHPTLQITDPRHRAPSIENIMDTRNALVTKIMNPESGEYTFSIRSQGMTSLTLYRRTRLPFQYGFCPRYPKSMRETSQRPMPGRRNYILIQVDVSYSSTFILKSVKIEIVDFVGNGNRTLPVLEQVDNRGLYACSVFVEPDKHFRMTVTAQDTLSYQERTLSTKILSPQKIVTNVSWSKPSLEIIEPESKVIDFGTKLTVPCKVNAYPTPSIWWEDDNGSTLPSEVVLLEIPSVYINYVTVENVTANSTIHCKCQNSVGEAANSMDLVVHRPFTFDVIQKPEDTTIEFGTEGELNCEVAAYPEAELRWYHNESEIDLKNTRFVSEAKSLVIKEMDLEDTGTYRCEAINDVKTESFTAKVDISGIESPHVDLESSELTLKPGDWTEIVCRITKGKPEPEISWSYRAEHDLYFSTIPDGAYADRGKLKIPTVALKHDGVYKCEASNILGKHSGEITVIVKYAPVIKNSDPETVTVNEGTPVILPCEVDASPEAEVRWEMSQDDVIIALDKNHVVDDEHSLRFDALWKDSGNYHCFAENSVGKAEKTYTVNVLVKPYIEPPKFAIQLVNIGENVVLPCNVSFGNPVPITTWKFISYDSATTILSRGNSTNTLRLKSVSKAHEGFYMCIADNKVGTDSIKINLRVL